MTAPDNMSHGYCDRCREHVSPVTTAPDRHPDYHVLVCPVCGNREQHPVTTPAPDPD